MIATTAMTHRAFATSLLGRLPALVVSAFLLIPNLACQSGSPDVQELERTVDHRIRAAGETEQLRRAILEDVRSAEERIWAALTNDVLDQELADALVEASNEGLDVQVVGDADDKGSAPFETLRESDVETTFGDGTLSYLPNPNLSPILGRCILDETARVETCYGGNNPAGPCEEIDERSGSGGMCRPGSFNLMSHRFLIVDDRTVWNLAGGIASDKIGTVGWKAESELIHEDFEREFRQMSGGVFATTLDVFNGPVKSGTDDNVDYTTDDGMLQIRFNPQERLMKHVIDEVYRARSSIQIMSSVLRNPFLLDALEYKAEHGFEVQIVVGEKTESGGQPPGDAKERLKGLGARVHEASGHVPSVVVIDGLESDDGREWARTALALSHPLWHAQPFRVVGPPRGAQRQNDRAKVFPSDHFVDGTLYKIYEYTSNAGDAPQIDQMKGFVQSAWNQASEL